MAFTLTYRDGQQDDYDDSTKWAVEDGVLKMGREEDNWLVFVSPSHWATIEVAKDKEPEKDKARDEKDGDDDKKHKDQASDKKDSDKKDKDRATDEKGDDEDSDQAHEDDGNDR